MFTSIGKGYTFKQNTLKKEGKMRFIAAIGHWKQSLNEIAEGNSPIESRKMAKAASFGSGFNGKCAQWVSVSQTHRECGKLSVKRLVEDRGWWLKKESLGYSNTDRGVPWVDQVRFSSLKDHQEKACSSYILDKVFNFHAFLFLSYILEREW